MKLKGKFTYEHIRDGVVIDSGEMNNGITDVGLNKILDVMFGGVTPITTWYCGLIDNASFSALAAGDTAGSHSGWIESTAYSESVRQTWTPGSASSRTVTNGTQMTFSINGTATLYGLFISSLSTKSGTTGTLWATAAFATTKSVVSGDSIKITYTVSG